MRKYTGDLPASASFLLASRIRIQLGLQCLAYAASLSAHFLSPPSGGQQNACRDLLPSHDGKNALYFCKVSATCIRKPCNLELFSACLTPCSYKNIFSFTLIKNPPALQGELSACHALAWSFACPVAKLYGVTSWLILLQYRLFTFFL